MNFYEEIKKYLDNNLFTNYALEADFPNIYNFTKNENTYKTILDNIICLYDATQRNFQNYNEHQFEDEFISKVLDILGWKFIRQDEKIIQGKLEKPDFLLFSDENIKANYENLDKETKKSSNEFTIIMESKAYNVQIDNKKVKENPHFQILRYLSNLKKNYGFLTNGRFWRFYDNSTLSANKVFYEINLEQIIKDKNYQAFAYFYSIFASASYTEEKHIEKSLQVNKESKIKIEDDLKSIIYGTNGNESLFEFIGSKIYNKTKADLKLIYENSLYFVFRLLFIAYFEDKFENILEKHKYFKSKISIKTLLQNLSDDESSSAGFGDLEMIFQIYNKGKGNFDMPVFNGGLFDESKTTLLNTPKIFSDKDLKKILEKLLYYKDKNLTFKRDYKTLSIEHLGTIYEGLLSYFFEVANEDIYYVSYKEKSKEIECYFDNYDFKILEKSKKLEKYTFYEKGQIYLKNSSNSRKSTASFYTPQSIANFLIQSALKDKLNNENILKFKILDNACGSGHFLVGVLNAITHIVLNDFEHFTNLKQLHEQEKENIANHIKDFTQDYELDESDVLKRLLLKRIIYGVDLNPFSIELTKLSLWIDSFIFGTPLSFIEHHIKCGNALVGSSISDFENLIKQNKENIFTNSITQEFEILQEVFEKLDNLQDTNEEQIKQSKQIYQNEITPKLDKLNLYLDYINSLHFANKEELQILKALSQDDIQNLSQNEQAKAIISKYQKEFNFFNYELEFPEIIENQVFKGFDIIIGNPPWDKTKFSDDDFFPQYKSDYRSLIASKKKEIQDNLLAKDYIKQNYEKQKAYINDLNEYYKKAYPLNKGSGDGNLFRLFVEKNLSLLKQDGNLAYVLPSALMFEDGSLTLRKEILENKTLEYFYSFENRQAIFADVDSRYKFALMLIKNTQANNAHKIKTMFYKTDINSLKNKDEILTLGLEDIKKLSPNHLALMELKDKQALEILRKSYNAFQTLSFDYIDFVNELHMTNDKDLFIEEFGEGLLPLYEGKMIHQFDTNFSQAIYFLEKAKFDERLKSKELYRAKKATGKELNPELIKYDREFFRLAYRAIASDTNERTLIASLLPKNCGFGHSMFANVPKLYILKDDEICIDVVSYERILLVLALLNSLVVDFIIRNMVQINVSKTYLERIPLPQPSDKEIQNNEIYKTLAKNALLLQLYNDKNHHFDELKQEFNIKDDEIPKTKKAYDILRAKNDLLVKELYSLSDDEFSYMISTFKVLNEKQSEYIALLRN
ncbi:class I SAM-dependent DNA methyltransferase [Campylobacter lari]|uniref:class I SAM-dependent DNA methyltransferase n=1 Tax=Campylobacter lari TaxID=201 RepID=UPI0017E01DC9|nr:class I SAM-dependent DNA methyltransferase [Campylobacter lari]EAJ5696594.1 class I SAM-dependent DNA methyltransferase [Campylobacter lari]MCR2078967.1 class I SAM-dependent DNA methyltransferase [Campylobacter lari subsp. concheus]